ncbi:MAG: hypothetical protein ABSF79_12785 [Smithellaceae bacterium]|jgi:hypothetical protein
MKKMLLLVILLALVSIVSVAIAIQRPAPDPASAATAIQKPTPDPASAAPVFTEPVKPMTKKKLEKMEKFSGLIEKVDKIGKAIVVRGKMMKEEKFLTFAINDKTKITKDKMTTTRGDLKKDMQVSIEYKKEMNKMIAVTIEISVPNDAPDKYR